MAAAAEKYPIAMADLRQLQPAQLEPLLEEEIAEWQRELDWDFRPSADLVRRFVRAQSLNGHALMSGGRAVGYCYYVCEERKGLLGDVYVADAHRGCGFESQLVSTSLRSLLGAPFLTRIESQFLLQPRPLPSYPLAPERLRTYRRCFMALHTAGRRWPPGRASQGYSYANWREGHQDVGARLIARAYQGHVDADINDQYQSVAGARRFLANIVQYPGCGSFFAPGSYVAFSGRDVMAGLSLASLVAFDVGHITQICVDEEERGRGVGYELLRLSLDALIRNGCRKVSLTVTASNDEALRLYYRMGFVRVREFEAYVWLA